MIPENTVPSQTSATFLMCFRLTGRISTKIEIMIYGRTRKGLQRIEEAKKIPEINKKALLYDKVKKA